MRIEMKELNHVAIHVRDLAASMHFYGEALGLRQIPRPGFDFPGAWYAFGDQELHLIEDRSLQPAERHHHHFALRVADAYAARAELERVGVAGLRGPGRRPDGILQVYFTDPDGYEIELFSAG